MAYSEMIPTVLKSLESRRLSRLQPSWATQAGANVLATQLPQFENPWTQIAAAFGQGVLGSAIQSYGQGKDAEALQAYDQQTALDLAEATAETDPMKRAAILREKGLGDVAQVFDVAQMMTEAERAEKLQDPEYLLREKQFASDVGFKEQELDLKRQELDISKKQADALALKYAADAKAAESKTIQDFVNNANLSVKSGNQAQQGLINTMLSKEKVIDVYRDFSSRGGVIIDLVKQVQQAQQEGNVEAANAGLQKIATYFTKQPNEALNVSDAEQYLQQTSYMDTLRRQIQSITGKGGTYVTNLKTATELANTINNISNTLRKQATAVVNRYATTADEISRVPLPIGVSPEAVKQLQKSGVLLAPTNMINTTFPDLRTVTIRVPDPNTGEMVEREATLEQKARLEKYLQENPDEQASPRRRRVGRSIARSLMRGQ